ncbi:MAG: hypothetical protein H7245_00675 [Candidatus Saccharibacteria bacterium]|nr:hypothetical protein [Pseudorhodobacter sp.]
MEWFRALTGLASDDPATVQAGVSVQGDTLAMPNGRRLVAGRLKVPALADLPAPPQGARRLTLSEVVADVQSLHADPANAGAVFQVASQFNLLEMVGPNITPEQGIARYAHDRTQGPACAMACAAGTIWRNYLVPLGDQTGQSATRQVDTIADLGAALGNAGDLWRMRNGYAMPLPGGLARAARAITAADPQVLKGLVRVGVQHDTQVTLGQANHLVTQVYASAMPISYANDSDDDWEPLARLVLEAAYEATFAVAMQSAAQTGVNRLFLTRLGGGAFGNPSAWINDAIARAVTRFAACDLDVVLVSFGRPSPDNRALLT